MGLLISNFWFLPHGILSYLPLSEELQILSQVDRRESAVQVTVHGESFLHVLGRAHQFLVSLVSSLKNFQLLLLRTLLLQLIEVKLRVVATVITEVRLLLKQQARLERG